jgi:hypothetical protein
MLTPDLAFSIAFSCKIHYSVEQEARRFATHQLTWRPAPRFPMWMTLLMPATARPKYRSGQNHLNLEQLNQEKGSGRDFCGTTRWLTAAHGAAKSRPPGFSNVVGLAKKDQVIAGLLRDSVVLCRALG